MLNRIATPPLKPSAQGPLTSGALRYMIRTFTEGFYQEGIASPCLSNVSTDTVRRAADLVKHTPFCYFG